MDCFVTSLALKDTKEVSWTVILYVQVDRIGGTRVFSVVWVSTAEEWVTLDGHQQVEYKNVRRITVQVNVSNGV